ncbi:Similar to trappc13: Trafficking protein particle complex subunit 13 (Danio rerio) [Cotesia congregata]|uniref:Similar to trappc13: Trafficking protein particle complex subunit 13 (Danio rerio) n=1 Tax=Cotesia congregata TaxID=51543 RepID=A0A8J2MV98_COTCN|nr:Similar to trappc13: Trafficking protein particle complex subunit 13 (Danio rerio) [Cotesia congregata]
MDTKPKNEHLLALKVMRLTRPTMATPVIVTCDSTDLPGNTLNNELKNDCTALQGMESLAVGQFMVLPQSFGNIYLGEIFSCYLCVHNGSNQLVKHINVKRQIILSMKLVCEVSYVSTVVGSAPQSFRKFFKFQVVKPLDVKTKFFNTECDEVYVEAQIQNLTAGPICLEKVSLESSHLFTVSSLNTNENGDSVYGKVNILDPNCCRQYLYYLKPQPSLMKDPKLIHNATNIENVIDFKCHIVNTSERNMDLLLSLESNSSLAWCGISDITIGSLKSGAFIDVPLRLIPLESGLITISGLKLMDTFLKRVYDYEHLAQIFVSQVD